MDNQPNLEEFVMDILNACVKHSFLPVNTSRDFKIKFEYRQLRQAGMAGGKARETLADRYCTSSENIQRILYSKPKKMNNP